MAISKKSIVLDELKLPDVAVYFLKKQKSI